MIVDIEAAKALLQEAVEAIARTARNPALSFNLRTELETQDDASEDVEPIRADGDLFAIGPNTRPISVREPDPVPAMLVREALDGDERVSCVKTLVTVGAKAILGAVTRTAEKRIEPAQDRRRRAEWDSQFVAAKADHAIRAIPVRVAVWPNCTPSTVTEMEPELATFAAETLDIQGLESRVKARETVTPDRIPTLEATAIDTLDPWGDLVTTLVLETHTQEAAEEPPVLIRPLRNP